MSEENLNKYPTTGYVSEIRNFGNLLFLILRSGYKTVFKKEIFQLYQEGLQYFLSYFFK